MYHATSGEKFKGPGKNLSSLAMRTYSHACREFPADYSGLSDQLLIALYFAMECLISGGKRGTTAHFSSTLGNALSRK